MERIFEKHSKLEMNGREVLNLQPATIAKEFQLIETTLRITLPEEIIAESGGGDYLCLDTDSTEEGLVGQVLYFWHDWGDRTIDAKGPVKFIEICLNEKIFKEINNDDSVDEAAIASSVSIISPIS